MKKLKYRHSTKRYRIRLKGVRLTSSAQIDLYKRLDRLEKKLPNDSKIDLRLTNDGLFHAKLLISGLEFGCNLETSHQQLERAISNLFSGIDEEVKSWMKSPKLYDKYSPYFGGYPAHYRELTMS